MFKPCLTPVCCLVLALLAGCATGPQTIATPAPTALGPAAPRATPTPTPPPLPPRFATIIGSEEASTMLDNFTAFVAAVDGHTVPTGRKGWNVPLDLAAGRHTLTVQFNRGVFTARTDLALEAAGDASYELKYATDVQLLTGNNTYCDFWVVDRGTGQPVTGRKRASVGKIPAQGEPAATK